jgi:acyl carrier protein
MDIEEVEKALIKFLVDNILGEGVTISSDSSLAEIGVDSYSIVEILLFIERKYGFVIPDDHLKPENFKNVNSIAKTVMEVSKHVD